MRKRLLIALALIGACVLLASVALQIWLQSDAIRSTIESEATRALGVPVRVGSASATLFPRLAVALGNVGVGDPAIAAIADATIEAGWELIWSRGADFPLESIHVGSAELIVGAERVPVTFDGSLDGDRLQVASMTARLGDATVQIQGEMSSLARKEGRFDVRADVLPVDAVFAALQALVSDDAAPAVTFGARRVDAFACRLEATRAGIVMDPVSFTVDGGRIEARVTFDPSAKAPELDVRGTLSDLDVTRLQTGAAAGNAMTGRLAARYSLRMPVRASLPAMIDGATGTVDVEVPEGRMPGIHVVRQAVIGVADRARPAPDAPATDVFSRLKASMTVQGGTAKITSLAMQTRDFNLSGTGTYRLATGGVSLDVNLTLSEALSDQAGRDLDRYTREGRRIVLPATIGGTLGAPTASIDVGEAAGRAIRNRLDEEAKSVLDRLLKRPE